jgi:hypothetical protein
MTEKNAELRKDALDLAVVNYGHIEQQATLAATKASLLVAAQALLGATYVGVAKDFGIFFYYKGSLLGLAFGAAGAFILISFILSLYAIFPKSKADNDADLLFFASIKDNFTSSEDYVKAYFGATRAELDRQLLENIHGKACWLRRNFGLIRASILMTFLGASLAACSVALMSPGLRSAA